MPDFSWGDYGIFGGVIFFLITAVAGLFKWSTNCIKENQDSCTTRFDELLKLHSAERHALYQRHESERERIIREAREERTILQNESNNRTQRLETVLDQIKEAIYSSYRSSSNNNKGEH